jgi:hypothetical protein
MRQYALVKLTELYSKFLKRDYPNHPLLDTPVFIYLGEIPNMRDHCVVAEYRGKNRVLAGYHLEVFEEVSENDT